MNTKSDMQEAKSIIMDKIQEQYNLLVHQSDIQYTLSITKSKKLDGKRDYLQALAYGFQEAAAMLRHAFPELIYRQTIREKEIREHHLEDEASQRDELKNQTETDL